MSQKNANDGSTETELERYHREMKQRYAEKVDTDKPVEVGDTVDVYALSGVPSSMADYPLKGTVYRVEPRGVGTHNIFADWFIRVRFDEDETDAIYGSHTELFCIGASRRSWDETPVEVKDDD